MIIKIVPQKKGVIFGWSTMGFVVASVTYAPYITKLFDKIGLGTTYIGIAIIFWILAVLCIFTSCRHVLCMALRCNDGAWTGRDGKSCSFHDRKLVWTMGFPGCKPPAVPVS